MSHTILPRTFLFVLISAAMASAAAPKPADTLWELSPYRVQIFMAAEDAPQLTARRVQGVQEFLVTRIESLIGASWNARVDVAPPELAVAMLGGLQHVRTEDLPKAALAGEKVILVGIKAGYFGFPIEARELDCRTRTWGATVTHQVGQAALIESVAADSMLSAFAPLAQIEKVDGKLVTLRLRAGDLPLRDPKALPLAAGDLFRPVLRQNDRDGNLRNDRPPQAVPWSYLLVRTAAAGQAQCELFTGLRSPLSARRRGRTEQLAVGVRPPQGSTRLIVHSRVDKTRRLFGYEVYSYAPDSAETVLLGRTDINGALMIAPAKNPLRNLIVKSGGEMLARLPLVPGLEQEALASVADDDDRLAVEGYITGLQEEIVDLVAQRSTLVARIRGRIEAGDPQAAQPLLAELRKLRNREQLIVLLNEQQRKYFSSDPGVREKVKKLFTDTREVMIRNLDPALVEQVASEVNQALKAQPAAPPARPATTGAASSPALR